MDQLSTAILGACLIIIMLGMGLSLVMDDFKRVIIYPKAVIVGLVNQILLLPLVGYLIASLSGVSPEIAVGIMILAACPGGPTSNLISHLARGNTALSVTLTALSSFITIITIPFIVNFALVEFLDQGQIIRLDPLETILQVTVIIIIPILIGMFIRQKKPLFAMKMAKPVRIASGIVLALVIIGICIKEKDNLLSMLRDAGLVSITLNLITMGLGFFTAKLFRLNDKSATSISIESGIQNGTLGISVAVVLLDNSQFAVTPAVYGVLMFFTGGAMIYWGSRRFKPAAFGA